MDIKNKIRKNKDKIVKDLIKDNISEIDEIKDKVENLNIVENQIDLKDLENDLTDDFNKVLKF